MTAVISPVSKSREAVDVDEKKIYRTMAPDHILPRGRGRPSAFCPIEEHGSCQSTESQGTGSQAGKILMRWLQQAGGRCGNPGALLVAVGSEASKFQLMFAPLDA